MLSKKFFESECYCQYRTHKKPPPSTYKINLTSPLLNSQKTISQEHIIQSLNPRPTVMPLPRELEPEEEVFPLTETYAFSNYEEEEKGYTDGMIAS